MDVVGPIDAGTAGELKDYLGQHLGGGERQFVINLTEVEFIDSSGLGTLVGFLKMVRVGEGEVRLAGLQAPVQKIFDLTRLSNVFPIYTDVDTACA